MSYALLTGASEISSELPLTCDSPDSHRERLLRTARQAGLEPNDVVRLAEALTGHSWDRCGRAEISLIGGALSQLSQTGEYGQHRLVQFRELEDDDQRTPAVADTSPVLTGQRTDLSECRAYRRVVGGVDQSAVEVWQVPQGCGR